jgi:hypothetical protein
MVGNYAFSEKYALMATGSMSYKTIFSNYSSSGSYITDYIGIGFPVKFHAFEFGIGRYNILPYSNRLLEVFVGAGYGMGYNSTITKQNFLQGFAQLNIGKKLNHVEIGWSLRTAFSGFHSQVKMSDMIEHERYQAIHLEPQFLIRVGGQRVRWFYRSGLNLAFPLSSNSMMKAIDIDPGHTILHFSTGISYRF